jgi:hypothetical protein
MVEVLHGVASSSFSSSSSSNHHPDPCPFCALRVSSEYSLLLHIELEHSEDYTGDRDNVSIDTSTGDSVIVDYILCPEEGCEEYIRLLELQTHMDFHDAEHLSMMDQTAATAAVNDTSGEREHRHRHHHHHRRREGERDKDGGARPHHHHRPREHREHRGGEHVREKGKEKDGKVTFISPPSSRGLSWFEKVALAIAPPQHVLPEQRERRHRSRSESVGPPRRSESTKRDAAAQSVRRSESKREKIELRKGEPRKHVAPPPTGPAERSSKPRDGIRKLGVSFIHPFVLTLCS